MDDFLNIILIFIGIILVIVILGVISCSNVDCRTTEQKLKEASTSAQLKSVCEEYKTTAFKDVPIKCLQQFDIGTRK
jgi:hypothetical protein